MGLRDHISETELNALEERFEAEDRDAEEAPEVPEAERVVSGHNAFAAHGAVPREVDGVPFEDLQ